MYISYVAQQPILDAQLQTVGYELLFRDGENNAFPKYMDADHATCRLVVENYLSVGSNSDSKRCFVNFPYNSLILMLPLALPKDDVVIEVLETCPPTDELFESIKELHRLGYKIALDDFVYSEKWVRFYPYVDIIKLDIMEMGIKLACALVKESKAQGHNKCYLAERVETAQEFDMVKAAGFELFQGFFFSKPRIVKQNRLSPNAAIAMQLLFEICKPIVNFDRVSHLISKDVALSYELLRFVNSIPGRLEVEITSFHQALVYLGEEKLKMFVSLVAASYISPDKPKELFKLSLQRAQFCQLVTENNKLNQYKDQAFLVGLFSTLDAWLDLSLDKIVSKLPLSDTVKDALNKRSGPFGELLNLEECFEKADWQGVESHCMSLGLQYDDVTRDLNEAQRWSQETSKLA